MGLSASSPQQYIPDLLLVLLVAFYIPFTLLDLIMQVRLMTVGHAGEAVAGETISTANLLPAGHAGESITIVVTTIWGY